MIKIENFSKEYIKNKQVVGNLNITINDGDIYAIIGHNGAGKTTILKSIAGILEVESGCIYVNGLKLKTNPLIYKQQIAYIPDNPEIYEHIRGIDYLNFIADIYGIPKKRRKEQITKYTEIFSLNNLGDIISSYSHGMKQKLVIIAAFIHEPKVLILDEPFVGLDPISTYYLKEEMKSLANNGATIIFSTHILEVAEKLSNKIAILKNGKLICEIDTKNLPKNKSLEELYLELDNDKTI